MKLDILVNMLKKEKKRAADALSVLEQQGLSLPKSSSSVSENGTSKLNRMSDGANMTVNLQEKSNRLLSGRKSQSEQQELQTEKEEKTKAKICKLHFIIIISLYALFTLNHFR